MISGLFRTVPAPAWSRRRRDSVPLHYVICSAILLASIYFGSIPVLAQPRNNDYYSSQGTELLRNVEQYHAGPATDKLRRRFYPGAAQEIGFMLGYFPNHPQALFLMTQLCEQWKSSACSREMMSDVFDRAIAVNPNVAGTYVLQGIYLYRTKQLTPAIASFEKALTLDPDSLNAHYNLGLAYFETKQFELANEHAQRAYQLGAPLPGLRDKLKRAGRWKPVPTKAPAAASPAGPDSQLAPAQR